MHVQARATPAASPRSVEAFLKVLSEPEGLTGDGQPRKPINIEGVTGTNLEKEDDEGNDPEARRIVFSFDHDRAADVQDWLTEVGYTDVTFLYAPAQIFTTELGGNEPGQLLKAIRAGKAANPDKRIRDVLIGQATQDPYPFYVQISWMEG
jgi:hypothetical protein